MISKEYDEIVTVMPNGELQYLKVTKIVEDGVVLSSSNWRRSFSPGETDLPGRAAELAAILWTQEVIDAYVASLPEPLTGENNVQP